MTDILWWAEESWWERRSIPLLGFNLALRQVLLLSSTGLFGFAFSSAFSLVFKVSFPTRIGVFLGFLSVGFLVASKRIKMAPVELQLYYRFVRKQGILRSVAEPHRITPLNTIPGTKRSTRPLLLGTVAGCLLAASSLSVLASGVALKVTGAGLLVFVFAAGALSLVIDRKLRRVGRAQEANSVDELFSGIVLSAVLYFISLHSSPLILIPEVACGFLIVRGVLDIRRWGARKKGGETPQRPRGDLF